MHKFTPPKNTPNWLQQGLDHIWLPYAQMKTLTPPLPVERTSKTHIHLSDGRVLIDGVASWWTSVHGYNPPHILDAMKAQMEAMPHVMLGGLAHEQAYRLATRLAHITPGDLNHTFFTESGSVAVEVAMKIAVQYWRNLDGVARPKFLSFKGGYHGDTFATMAVCDPEEGMHSLFADALARQYVVDLPTNAETRQQLHDTLAQNKDIAAVLVEPLIQGAAGMRVYDGETLRSIREACDAHNVLLIFDEIFTGFGRTGAMFAADHAGVEPDIITLGKALTGGVTPLAATIASTKVFQAFYDNDGDKALMHGPTFCGHALGCAAANASLDLFETEPRLDQVKALEADLGALKKLSDRPLVKEVRILGAMAAVELVCSYDVLAARARFLDRGVFIRPLGNVIYLSPSYVMEKPDLERLLSAIDDEIAYLEAHLDA